MKDTTILRTIKYKNQLLSLNPEQSKDYITALVHYQETGEILVNIDPVVSLLVSIMAIEWNHDEETWNKKSEYMKWNKNAVKTFEKGIKQRKTEKNRTEQNETEWNRKKQKKQEIEIEKEIEDISSNDDIINSNEFIEDNINNSSLLNNNSDWQNENSIKKYGNEEINIIMDMISEVNWWAMDWTVAKNRQFARNLLCKIKAMPKVMDWTTAREDVLKMIIMINKDDPYHATKLSSPEKIHKNFWTLVANARTKIQEQHQRKNDWVF